MNNIKQGRRVSRQRGLVLILVGLMSGSMFGLAEATEKIKIKTEAAASNKKDAQVLETLLGHWQSVQGEFTQEVYDEEDELLEKTHGQMHLKKPGKFRWEVQSRDRSLIVADGKEIWHYDPDLQQVTVERFDPTSTSPLLFLTGKTQNLGAQYDIKSFQGKRNKTVCEGADGACFEMKPHQAESSFQWIRLGFKDSKLVSLEFSDQLGQHGWIYFNKIQVNESISDSLFHFKPPKGVDVVRRS